MSKKLYWEILDNKRIAVLKLLSRALDRGFCLAGGTALALQIGHRKSFDFDFFSSQPVTSQLKRKIINALEKHSVQTLVDIADELTITVDHKIKITILHYFWGPLFPLVKTGPLPLLSVKDIAAAKAYALGRRGNYRDYFDLYVLLKGGYTNLGELIKICRKKYGEIFSERMFLEQLVYFRDLAKPEKLMFLRPKQVSLETLKKFFVGIIRERQENGATKKGG